MTHGGTNIGSRASAKIASMGELCIEFQWGFRALNGYLHELDAVASGVPYSSLGISDRRHARMAVSVISPTGQTISDPYILRNERLTPPGSVAVLQLSGVMTADGDASTPGAQGLATNLRAAYANANVDAVVIETNSGGGEVTAMQILVGAVNERNKPVIGFGHMAASAAYGTLAATDEIIGSSQMAQFGSIGAVLTLDKEFLQYFNEAYLQIYGDNAPYKNEEFRAALAGDFGPFKALANKATDQFQAQVATQRPLTGADAYRKVTLSGRMFDAAEAKRRGLIDGVGTLAYAVKRAEAWAGMYKSKKKRA